MGAVADACEALGGTIEVKSQRGVGTRVEFAFPKDRAV
jgi:signal transduction histidine kinase